MTAVLLMLLGILPGVCSFRCGSAHGLGMFSAAPRIARHPMMADMLKYDLNRVEEIKAQVEAAQTMLRQAQNEYDALQSGASSSATYSAP